MEQQCMFDEGRYIVVYGYVEHDGYYAAIEELERRVERCLEQGWKLQGGVNSLYVPLERGRFQIVLMQALLKEEV